jgi:hypothetical protein
MPFWVRKACSFIHLNTGTSERPISLGVANVKGLIEKFIDQEGATLAQVAIGHLFRVYPELEGPALMGLSDKPAGMPTGLTTVLRKYGVFAQDGPIRPSGKMIEQALRSYKEQREAAQTSTQLPLTIDTDAKDRTAMNDWADELAVINKGRNLLEKKLRQLVLNFLRADALANKKRGSTKDRLAAALPEARRLQVNQIAADDAIEKFNWLELTALIQKEWPLFAPIFGDRKQFDQHAEIINDRYDTHAKDADAMDLALYRRSLKWLTDRLTAL